MTVLRIALGVALGGVLLLTGCSIFLAGSGDRARDRLAEELAELEPQSTVVRGVLRERLSLRAGDTDLRVQLLAITDPLEVEDYEQPETGRYVAAALRIVNAGPAPYDQALEATIVDQREGQSTSEVFAVGRCNLAELNLLPPSDARRGCLAVPMRAGRAPSRFLLTIYDGSGDSMTGEWHIP